jgi:hypothetical protein
MEKRVEAEGIELFYEEQRMWDTWIKYLLLVDFAFMTMLVSAVILSDKNATLHEKIFIPTGVALFNTTIIYLFRSIKFLTIITEHGIYFRLKPFEKKFRFIAKDTIKEFKEVKVNFFNTGIKIARKEKSFIFQGNKAVEIYTDKMKIVLGTNRYHDLNSALHKFTSLNKPTSILIYPTNSEEL